jgi:hypothetical protein
VTERWPFGERDEVGDEVGRKSFGVVAHDVSGPSRHGRARAPRAHPGPPYAHRPAG